MDRRPDVELPDEDHGLRRYKSTTRRRFELMEAFLARHLDLQRRCRDWGSGMEF